MPWETIATLCQQRRLARLRTCSVTQTSENKQTQAASAHRPGPRPWSEPRARVHAASARHVTRPQCPHVSLHAPVTDPGGDDDRGRVSGSSAHSARPVKPCGQPGRSVHHESGRNTDPADWSPAHDIYLCPDVNAGSAAWSPATAASAVTRIC